MDLYSAALGVSVGYLVGKVVVLALNRKY